uniref:CSON004356 protein n=1 Tax=Culicoides sonorensis TaxID=179676 RepID=A0A336LTB1_CULSO
MVGASTVKDMTRTYSSIYLLLLKISFVSKLCESKNFKNCGFSQKLQRLLLRLPPVEIDPL